MNKFFAIALALIVALPGVAGRRHLTMITLFLKMQARF